MARQLQHIDFAGPDAILNRALKLANADKLNEAIYWAASAAQTIGGAAFFDSNALAAALLFKAGYLDSALFYWDRIIRSAPHKLAWLEKAILLYLGKEKSEKIDKAIKHWLQLLAQVYIQAPSVSFLSLLHQHGIYIPGAAGVHSGKLKGWLWLPGDEKIYISATLPEPFALTLQPIGENAGYRLYTISQPLPQAAKTWAIDIKRSNGAHISGSPLICSSPDAAASKCRKSDYSLTILIPVYDDKRATLATLGALFASLKHNAIKPRILVIWDHGPDESLLASLQKLAGKGKFSLIVNDANLGFLGSVNKGLAQIPSGDVILLNADTLVHGNWIDRMAQAVRKGGTATITALSNEAEIMSYPSPQDRGKVTTLRQAAILDNAASKLPKQEALVEIPVGVGFCMLITREAIKRIGGLDGYHVCRGYGEESDFCLRAAQKGLKNYGLFNTFVGHLGEKSFGLRKRALASQNNVAIFDRFPDYQKSYEIALRDQKAKDLRREIALGSLDALPSLPILEIRPWAARICPPWIKDECYRPKYSGAALFLQTGQSPRALLRLWTNIPVMEIEFTLKKDQAELIDALGKLQFDQVILHTQSAKIRRLAQSLNLNPAQIIDSPHALRSCDKQGAILLGAPPLSLRGYQGMIRDARSFPDKIFYIFHIDTIWANVPPQPNIHELPLMEDYGTLGPEAFIMWDNFADARSWREWLTCHGCSETLPIRRGEDA